MLVFEFTCGAAGLGGCLSETMFADHCRNTTFFVGAVFCNFVKRRKQICFMQK